MYMYMGKHLCFSVNVLFRLSCEQYCASAFTCVSSCAIILDDHEYMCNVQCMYMYMYRRCTVYMHMYNVHVHVHAV